MVVDAYRSLDLLSRHPRIDPRRIAVMMPRPVKVSRIRTATPIALSSCAQLSTLAYAAGPVDQDYGRNTSGSRGKLQLTIESSSNGNMASAIERAS
jgi:hypothetical protein